MNEKAKKLVELMKQGIVQFIFKKKSTGKMRKAHGTLKRDLIPPEARRKKGRPKKRPENLVIYYDTDKDDIRSFKDYLLWKFSKKAADPSLNEEEKEEISEKPAKKKSLVKKHHAKRRKLNGKLDGGLQKH